jgi:hypothetical protein
MAKRRAYKEEFRVNRDDGSTRKEIPTPTPPIKNSENFIEDTPIQSPMEMGDDIVLDINQEVLRRIELESKKELQPNPIDEIKTIDESIEEIIKPIQKVVDTPLILDGNKEISAVDRVPSDILSRVVSRPKPNIIEKPQIIDVTVLSEIEKRRLASEEQKRRMMGDERSADIQQSFEEEQERRQLFDEEIEVMKFEFEQYLKDKYPEFDKDNIENRDVVTNPPSPEELQAKEEQKQRLREERRRNKQQQKDKKRKLQKQKLQRLEREKERKAQENEFEINKLRRDEINTFLEEDIIIEQKEKLARNPEIEGLNEVQIKLKEIEQFEKRLGRPIIPHRDIVESEESDLDPKAYTNSNDDLIIIPDNIDVVGDLDKLNKLRELRRELESETDDDKDYVSNRGR